MGAKHSQYRSLSLRTHSTGSLPMASSAWGFSWDSSSMLKHGQAVCCSSAPVVYVAVPGSRGMVCIQHRAQFQRTHPARHPTGPQVTTSPTGSQVCAPACSRPTDLAQDGAHQGRLWCLLPALAARSRGVGHVSGPVAREHGALPWVPSPLLHLQQAVLRAEPRGRT